jgi:hypothetical protein
MTDTKFFRKYLDLINEAEAAPTPTGGRTGSQQDIEKMMGNLGVSPEELSARQAQDDAAIPAPTTVGTVNPSVNPNITKQIAAGQNAEQWAKQDSADKAAAAQERGSNVQAMQKAGIDQKTIDMYANDDLQGMANQTAAALKNLPSKAEAQKMMRQGMASKEFASLPKDQQDAYRAQAAELDAMPDDYREQGAASFKQIGGIAAQDQADKKAGKGMYDPKLMQPIKANYEPRYTEKDIYDLEANKYSPSGFAGRNIAQTVAAKPVSPTAPTQTTTNLQVAKNPETGNPKLGSPLEVAPTQPTTAAPAPTTTPTQPTAAPAPTTTPTQPQPTQQKPTTEEKEDMDDRKLMRKYMDYLDEAPAQAINPNDPHAAAFGKQINAPAPNTNIDTRATAQRDKLAQQMASGKINSPAPQTVNPNQQYGGGYDPTKVQYAAGAKSQQPVNNQSSGYTAQSQAQKTPEPAVNNQSSGYTAQSQAVATRGAGTQSTPEPSLASQYIAANQPQSATVTKSAPAPATEPSLASQYIAANQPQTVAEEGLDDNSDDILKAIIRLIKK